MRAIVVAQLAERLLPISEVHISNPAIAIILIHAMCLQLTDWKDENEEKEAVYGSFFKKSRR